MKRFLQLCLLLCVVLILTTSLSFAQAPVGTISGVVADETGAVVPNANVTIRNKATGFERQLTSGADGAFSAPALPAGVYEVRVEMKGFRTLVREATVETGATTTADVRLTVGQTTEVVNVEAATAQVEYERHSIDGVVTRQEVQGLPLNGRSFMQLAQLQPGVTVSSASTSQYNTLFNISILGGASGNTAISVDGGPIKDVIEGAGTSMNFSQEVVQEFQVSSVNFDLSTDITSTGSVNVVTRSGSNQFHGSGYFFFRDHNMAAYPFLNRSALSPDPFFARRNPGFWLGGPIIKDKLFFFFNYEYQNQLQAFSVAPTFPSVGGLAGNFGSPYRGKTLSARFDYKLSNNHNLFARYSHDGNLGTGPNGGPTGGTPLPSSWLENVNWSDQTAFGITSTLKPTLVNDFRFTYAYWHNRNLFPSSSDCQNCLGLGFPQLRFDSSNGSGAFQVGDTQNATQGRDLRRFTWQDSVNWQKGTHRIRFGTMLEHATGTGFWGYCDPGCAVVFSPEFLTQQLTAAGVSAFFPTLPKKITSNQDLLNLPFAGASIGVGDPSQPPPYNIDVAKPNNRYRFYGQDSWKITPKFTLNYGLAWEYESNLFNEDLTKPAFLTPLYGSDLSPTQRNNGNVSPSFGFAWNVGNDNKTVIRGGAGLYYDTEQLYRRLQERSEIGPLGNGRTLVPSTQYTNIFPGIINVGVTAATGKLTPILPGALLPSNAITNLTLGQFMQIVAQQTPILIAAQTPSNKNDLTIRPIDVTKTGADLMPLHYPVQKSYHTSIGVQRQLRRDMVLSVDFVRRVFINELYGEPDLNMYNRTINGVQSPVIPLCAAVAPAQRNTPGVECSNGAITFWQPGARQTYTAMLVRADKRFANRYQITASYALQSEMGVNGIRNLQNYASSWGPQAPHHVLTVSGLVDLPWGFQMGLISSTTSLGPVMPVLSGFDINGNGSGVTPLPGLSYNCLNISCGKSDLAAAVANWNSTYAGKKDLSPSPKVLPTITLPANYSLGRVFNSQDLRLTKTFTVHERYKFSVLAEMFNIFNYANFSGFNFDPGAGTPPGSTFGLATQRIGQVFGSGGPRATQVGGRFTF